MRHKTAIILGDSFNNTLGLIRSLGEVNVKVVLILVGDDRLFVSKSRYVKEVHKISSLKEVDNVLKSLSNQYKDSFLITSNDKSAKWIDDNEQWLSRLFITPMRGKRLGRLFEKPDQCRLAEEYGITVPKSLVYNRNSSFPTCLNYPILLKPVDSNAGEKSDIHICRSEEEVRTALQQESSCQSYIVQEYIEKEYEINMIGVSTDWGVVVPGGIMKLRHYPTIYSPCSYGKFLSAGELGVDVESIGRLIESIGFHGPFSVEFLRKNGKNYFMEINFRHDGLAYTATAAGVNLLKMYVEGKPLQYTLRPTYMMDLSSDYCHVKDGNLNRSVWIKDFIKTGCQLNFNLCDPLPTIKYYLAKLIR